MRLFNDCIPDLALREIARVGARFTWTNKQVNPIRSVLDSVFVSPQWKLMFPLWSLKAVTSIGSDHTPLMLSSGHDAPPRTRCFHFESFWLSQWGFIEMVQSRWLDDDASPPHTFGDVDVLHHCSTMDEQFMRGRGANLGVELRAHKGALLNQIKALDVIADGPGLSLEEWSRRYCLEASLVEIFKGEICIGNTKEARTGFSRVMLILPTSRRLPMAGGESVPSHTFGMANPF
ncbi:hypothetical protein D1007_00925 [Hordeum vulgare]|nr:hypothetical protein D1007_00925 [Hordeum vulgare]